MPNKLILKMNNLFNVQQYILRILTFNDGKNI